MDKKYYWIKLKKDFFDLPTIDWLADQENGYAYIVLYQKLCLLTANNGGELSWRVGEMIIPYNAKKIAEMTRFDFDTVVVAMGLFKKLGLIYEQTDGVLRLSEIQEMVGSETQWAEKKRKQRQKTVQKAISEGQSEDNVPLLSEDNVRQEIEIDKEIDKEIENIESTNVDSKDFPSEKSSPAPYDKIRDLYNSICKSYPKCTRLSAGRKKAIHARLKSGYTVEDFKRVFQMAEQSRFLKGGNDRNWHADFDWLIKDTNMAKVLDGKYQDRQGGQNNYGCAAGAGTATGSAESKKAYGGILILPTGEIIDETGGSEPVGTDPLYDPDEDW